MAENMSLHQVTSQQKTIATVISLLFTVFGIGIVVLFIWSVLNDPDISQAVSTNRLILNFLDNYGIIIPLTVFGLGITFLNYSRRLLAGDFITSGWAQSTLFWVMVFSILGIAVHAFQVGTANIGVEPQDRIPFNTNLVLGLALLATVGGGVWRWLDQNRKLVFTVGEDTVVTRQNLVAWNLLIPTVVVMVLVAARPLERTFVGSLTDRTFAGAVTKEVNFVGLQNYTRLLGFRIDTIDCVRNPDNSCSTQIIENTIEENSEIAVDLNSIPQLEPAALDVGIDFFTPSTLNRLITENESFKNGLATAVKAILEEGGTTANEVQVVEAVSGNVLSVRVDGTPQEIAMTKRITELEGVDLSGVDLNYPTDVTLEGLNTYRIRSRIIRGALDTLVLEQYNPDQDATIDDVKVSGFSSFESFGITITRIETTEEPVYENVRDKVGEAYRNYAQVSTFDFFGTRYVLSARDAEFYVAVGNTLFFAVVTVTAELILGMIIALTVNSKFPGRGLVRAAMLIPWAIPTVVSAKLWSYMLLDSRIGVMNDMLIRLGVIEKSLSWLASVDTRIWSLVFVDVWKTTPFMALLILAGLQTIPSDIYEAADVDGAGVIRQFFRITLPLLRPTIAVALVFRTLDAIRAFDVFDVLVGKQLQSMATYNQFVLVETQEFGYASAIGVTMFLIILVFTIIYVRALGVDVE